MKRKELNTKLAKIKLLVMDVDGTLTDSAMYYSANGEELKRFSTRDGMGITLLQKNGIKTAIVTSENSMIAKARAEKLKIDDLYLACKDKTTAIKDIANKHNLELENIAFIGDDVNDGPVMKIAGVAACPKDAVAVIAEIAHFQSSKKGGHGAVREFCELILKANNKPIILKENW